MADPKNKQQTWIDAVVAAAKIGDGQLAPEMVDRALETAQRGLTDPGALSDDEIRLLCRSIVCQFVQSGTE